MLLIAVLIVVASYMLRGAEGKKPAPLSFLDAEALSKELAQIVERQPGAYGIYLKVLETGERLSVNDVEFPAASCYKLPLGLMIYEDAAQGRLSLESRIALQRGDWEPGTGVLQATRAGTQFTTRQLVRLAVVESDNIAANMLLRTVGKTALAEFYRKCGARVAFSSDNLSSPKDMGIFAERLVKFAQEKGELGHELLSFFLESKWKDRLALGLPDDVDLANKIGTLPGVVNDVGIVIGNDMTYVLAVMSKEVGATENGQRTIKLASLAIYTHLSQRASGARLAGTAIGKQILESMDY
jgi:beta-lactamase class A